MPEDAKGIYLPNGDFMPFRFESLTTEIATRQNAGATLADMGQWLDRLPDPDPILRKRGDDARILAELYTDDQVTMATLARKNRVLNAPQYGFRPGGPDGEPVTKEAQTVYDRLSQDLERVSLRPLISSILDAPFYGMTPLELMWRSGPGGWWHLIDIVARPYHWFAYDTDNRPFFRGEMGWAATTPEPLPVGKYVIVTHHATYDNPYGLRLLSRCLWPVAFKRGGLQFYAKFIERHGLPWVIGKAPKGANPQDKRDIAAGMARMVRDCVAVIPAGSEVTFMTPGSTQDMLHERFIARQDKSISKLLMGQTLTAEMEGRNNSQAAATTHEDVAEGLAEADKAMVADAFNEIAWLYARVNAGQGVFSPVFTYEEPEDLKERAALDELLCKMGVRFTAEHFQENYNLKPSEFTMQAASNQSAAPGAAGDPALPGAEGAPPAFAAAKGAAAVGPSSLAEEAQKRLDAAIKQIMPEALKSSGKFINKLEKAVKEAENPDQLELALVELLAPSVAPSEMEDLLARVMTAAAGFGAAAVRAEAEGDK
jgi:phage gp29-like protein